MFYSSKGFYVALKSFFGCPQTSNAPTERLFQTMCSQLAQLGDWRCQNVFMSNLKRVAV